MDIYRLDGDIKFIGGIGYVLSKEEMFLFIYFFIFLMAIQYH